MKASAYPEPLCADAAAAEPAGPSIGGGQILARLEHGLGHAHDGQLRDAVSPFDLPQGTSLRSKGCSVSSTVERRSTAASPA